MLLEINTRSEIPIYQQLSEQIIMGIATGELAIGESLPTVRQLADELGVNTMTISKSYNQLKEAGYLITDRRKGSVVTLPQAYQEADKTDLKKRLAQLLAEAKIHQLKEVELQTFVADIWSNFPELEEKKD
ncbi:GntR family transcriptional regulator [Enterococcus sp. MJM12]|uniref:GntR family transcriptional regulator n=1 Tax=Candidatus Enterococcus myersii TaxID=2815322 RepID=A0ABS3HA36_9ENTE|nr:MULTISPECIES: GntR family transcriptional regulator [unclassified Enterococcus]MBO0450311.1 GntR family transcriptional regulator [Enterococcus sp. MJM12]MCD1023968.1 GntR family transcriptional regulator [Enterococcus sp. SMC-9]